MTCVDRGQWHLGLAEGVWSFIIGKWFVVSFIFSQTVSVIHSGLPEICKAAGGQWTQTPCSTLKGCIDDRPKRFDLNSTSDFDAITSTTANFDHVVAPMDAAGWLEKFGQGSVSQSHAVFKFLLKYCQYQLGTLADCSFVMMHASRLFSLSSSFYSFSWTAEGTLLLSRIWSLEISIICVMKSNGGKIFRCNRQWTFTECFMYC